MLYRGYDLEQKTMMVGCQVIITHKGSFVRNCSVQKDMHLAVSEARAYVDNLLDKAV